MKDNYLIIKGSKREKGALNTALKELIPVLNAEKLTVFDTFEELFQPCDGCNYCENAGICKHRDLDIFFKEFESCDKIIFLSPVYNGSFSAPFKALVDRFQVYYTSFYKNNKTQPVKKHREAYFIASAGRDGEVAFQYMKSQLCCAFTILNIEMKNSFLINNTDINNDYSHFIEEIKRSLQND